ncbi:MAG: caspase family protein [Bacteroidales bacterium]|nr:caspase family protein [Bacteroidales bacterium]
MASTYADDVKYQKMLDESSARLFELNREPNKPQIVFLDPVPTENTIYTPKNKIEIPVRGVLKDESEVSFLNINDQKVELERTEEGYKFAANIYVGDKETLIASAADVYNNLMNASYSLKRTEVDAPQVKLLAPYASDNGEIYLTDDSPNLYIEGQVDDESLIASINIDGVAASYRPDDFNPTFSATIDIRNKNKFNVITKDKYGNISETGFHFNREAADIMQNNPMGKTWVVFVENSNYQNFASLDGPSKDVSLMKSAFARYKIHNVIHKQDMSKKDMERFFSIELRDLVRSNQVNSLLVWYAGHGKFINETGYWIPTDAQRDDEFTYFNINALKAAMQAYSNYITHTLVITDACESGPTFYQAMRSGMQDRSCNDWQATRFRSSQVFSSAGYELAVDNSQFTKTFANSLINNPNACMPIEEVVTKVTQAVESANKQKPKFGKIAGLEDENGTFFFMQKE